MAQDTLEDIIGRLKIRVEAGLPENTPGAPPESTLTLREQQQARAQCLIRMANVPKRLASAKISDLTPSASRQIEAFVGSEACGLFITGPTGTGKSHMAVSAMRAHLERTPGNVALAPIPDAPVALFITAPWLLMEIRWTYRDNSITSER